jgi:hypothetical protein
MAGVRKGFIDHGPSVGKGGGLVNTLGEPGLDIFALTLSGISPMHRGMKKFVFGLKSRGTRVVFVLTMVVLCVSAFAAPVGAAEMREWQDQSGKFKVTAAFKEVNADHEVVMELEDGAIRPVAFDKLSAKDQAYVAKLAPESNLTPTAPANGASSKAPKRKSDAVSDEDVLLNDEKWDRWGWKVAVAGLLVLSIAGIVVLIDAFCESVGWGLACFIVPLANLVYIASHWHRPWASRAGMMMFLGVGLTAGAVFGLEQTKRVSEMLQAAAENPSDPFRALDSEPLSDPD